MMACYRPNPLVPSSQGMHSYETSTNYHHQPYKNSAARESFGVANSPYTSSPSYLQKHLPHQGSVSAGFRCTVGGTPKSAATSRMDPEEPITRPHVNDVLMGRGGKNNQHSGNEQLRGMARLESDNYRKSSKKGKSQISRQLVHQVRSLNPPGRFLKRDGDSGEWHDVGDDIAREKASQVLRDAVALLPDENEAEESSEPIPVDTVASDQYAPIAASIPPSDTEQVRSQSAYYQRATAPMMSQQHSPDMPMPSPLTSQRKRHREPHYGYDGYARQEGRHSPISNPTRRRYAQPQHQQPPAYAFSPRVPPSATLPSTLQRVATSRSTYNPFFHSAPLEPTLPRSQPEMRQHSYYQATTNRPPTISARQNSNASAQSLRSIDFDLFNGELIESDHEEQKRSSNHNPF